MSRSFELMQEIEKTRTFSSNPTAGSRFPVPDPFPVEDSARQVCLDGDRKFSRHELTSDGARSLVQRIFLLQAEEPPQIVVFAGIDHGSGCSRIALSVAEILAGSARGAVCLVEANFRSPALPAMLGTTNHHGLTNALLEEGPIRSFSKPVSNEGLWLLSSGSLAADSPTLLSSQRLKSRMQELREEFAFVIIDAPPMTRYADAIAMGQLSDGIVLVLEAESTRREPALLAVETLRSSKIPILGAVLNNRTFPIPEKIYRRL